MKKITLTIAAMFLFMGTAFTKELSGMTNNLVGAAEKVQTAAEGLANGPDSKTDVQKSINELKEVLNQLEKGIEEEINRYGDRRPYPGPRPYPRPNPEPYPYPDYYDNISASCRLDIGGNFFTPDTNVECTVYGRNAAGYEIRVISRLGDRVMFHGRLNPRLRTQYFTTNERKVGGVLVKYEVYILTTRGQRIHVATL